jgi:mannose-1-phosphate guanylyltransferase/phosphomannomutase
MQAIILAGGSGTRLRPLTYTTPKPMLPVGGRPALVRIAEALQSAGFSEVLITTNYLAEVIDERLREYSLPLPVRCLREDKPMGTAGCIKNAIGELGDEFLVIQGDAVAEVDYAKLLQFHHERKADVTISAIRVQDPREFGIMDIDGEGQIQRFQEKPRLEDAFSDLANAGFYVMKKSVFDYVPEGEPFDFSKDLFPILMRNGKRFFAFELSGYWVDIGRPQSYLEGNNHALKGCAEVAPDVEVPISATLAPPFIISAGARLGENCVVGPNAILGRGAQIGSGAVISGSVLFEDVSIGVNARLHDCIVGTRSHIGAGARIGALAVIGDGCDIGTNAEVAPFSRVGPITPVASGTVVEGVVSPRLDRLDSLQRAVARAAGDENLDADQRLVYGLLAEFGELTGREVMRLSGLDPEPVEDTLRDLEERGLILFTLDYPRRYALTREMPVAPRRILFVDDLPDTRAIYALALTMHGFEVQAVQNGAEALELARAERFDAIVTDIAMPGLDVFETIEKLRLLDAAGSTSILILTAHADNQTRQRARELKADAILQKPVLPQELLMRLSEVLRGT